MQEAMLQYSASSVSIIFEITVHIDYGVADNTKRETHIGTFDFPPIDLQRNITHRQQPTYTQEVLFVYVGLMKPYT